MRGLLKKDLALLFCNSAMIVAAVFLFVGFAFMGKDGGQFIIAYMTIFVPMVTNSTISYDDMDNGMAYLMTLPVTRKQYVYSKYLFGMSAGFFCWLFACVVGTASNVLYKVESEPGEWLFLCGTCLGILIFVMSLMIPVQLKFGAEKAKIVIYLIMVGVMSTVWFLNSILDNNQILSFVNEFPAATVGIVIIFAVVSSFISLFISIGIQEKKEW